MEQAIQLVLGSHTNRAKPLGLALLVDSMATYELG